MLRIKICGITRLEDALFAAKLGADAIGFIFYPKSPRCISLEAATQISKKLPTHIARVGVFVNPSPKFTTEAVETVGLTAIQFHGVLDADKITLHNHQPKIIAIPVKDGTAENHILHLKPVAECILLDTHHPTLFGGTGKTFDWALGAEIANQSRIILAGGLTPENISEAVKTVQPYAVDVSSGIETAAGIKDHDKLTKFFKNLRAYRNEWKTKRDRLFPFA